MDKSDCHNIQSTLFSFATAKRRNEFPPITIITPHDTVVSAFTKCLERGVLRRIINCARHSLQILLKATKNKTLPQIWLDELFESLPAVCLESYDAVIHLRHKSNFAQNKGNWTDNTMAGETGFATLAEFDVIQTFIVELESSFQLEDKLIFHYNPEAHNIGVKVSKKFQNSDILHLKTLMEDIKIIGKGLVTDVEIGQYGKSYMAVD